MVVDAKFAGMDNSNEFIANEKALIFYAGKPIINRQHVFNDQCGNPYSLSAGMAFTFKIWQERDGGLQVINWTSPINLAATDNILILNAPDEDTTIYRGKYYYEIAEIIAGGYEILLAYGQADFI
jgi:hypothetical protein